MGTKRGTSSPALKRRAVLAAVVAMVMLPLLSPATASADNNKGDVWVDNVGQPPGPGHEMDPHLACADIILWGDKMADPSGTFTIDGWPPSGSGAGNQAWPGTAAHPGDAPWSYNQATGGSQDILIAGGGTIPTTTPGQPFAIPVAVLIAHAIANGDSPQKNQGFHFKLQFSQDPQKHKTFWVRCTGVFPGSVPEVSWTPLLALGLLPVAVVVRSVTRRRRTEQGRS